jgi:hypothetical protein
MVCRALVDLHFLGEHGEGHLSNTPFNTCSNGGDRSIKARFIAVEADVSTRIPKHQIDRQYENHHDQDARQKTQGVREKKIGGNRGGKNHAFAQEGHRKKPWSRL